MTNVDRVNEGISHQATDQAHHAISGQNSSSGKTIAGHGGTLDVIHGLNQIVDAERNRRHQDHPKKLKTGEHMAYRRDGDRKPKISKGFPKIFYLHIAVT